MALLKNTLSADHQSRCRWATNQLQALLLELDSPGWEVDRNDADTLETLRNYAGYCYNIGRGFHDLVDELSPPAAETDKSADTD